MDLRKNAAALTAAEREAFVRAVLGLKRRPSRLRPDDSTFSRYDDYVAVHRDAMVAMMDLGSSSWAHQVSVFAPWHRVLLRQFELDLQSVVPGVTIPYWDWTRDQGAEAPIWVPDFLGGDGQGATGEVTTGPFAGRAGDWPIRVKDDDGDPDFLVRRLGQAPDAALPTPALWAAVLAYGQYDVEPWEDSLRDRLDREEWDGFRIWLEIALHNPVHRWVGGNMVAMSSPNDPVFWLHHCAIDLCWARWQHRHTTAARYLPASGGPPGNNLDEPMIFAPAGAPAPWDATFSPADVLDHRSVGYDYVTPEAPDAHVSWVMPEEPELRAAERAAERAAAVQPRRAPRARGPRRELPMFVLPHELPEVGGPGAPTAPHAHGTGHAHHLGGTDAAARVAELAPSAAQRIVVTTTPHPNRFRGPDQRLLELGVIDDMQGGMHAARIQAALARIGLRIRRTDVVTGPAITVSGCTDSVLEHATS